MSFPGPWTDADVARLLHETQAEALAELKATLKAQLVPALLTRALQIRSEPDQPAVPAAAIPATKPEASRSERPVMQPLAAFAPAASVQNAEAPTWAYYVYGVTPNVPKARLPQAGIDPAHPIEALPHRSLQALVSRVPLDAFGETALQARLDDPAWLTQTVRTHHTLLTHIQEEGAVLPMRFCTICRDEASIRRFLDDHYDDFVQTLGMLEYRQEWGVKIRCDSKQLTRHVAATNARLRALHTKIQQQPDGIATVLRKKLDEVVTAETDLLQRACVEQSHRMLAEMAEQAFIHPRSTPRRAGDQDDLVLDAAYLVPRDRWELFRNRFELMQTSYADLGFVFELTGPWPPQHFFHLEDAAPAEAEMYPPASVYAFSG